MTMPGLARLCADEVREIPGLNPIGVGNDGRADIVAVQTADSAAMQRALALTTCEDVFLSIGAASTDQSAAALAASLLSPRALERAIVLRDRILGYPLKRRARVRVIARVLDERRFQRTRLRDALLRSARAARPNWRLADTADVEIWAVEWRRGEMIAAIRLSDVTMRQGDGRLRERPGALRPVVARAMLRVARSDEYGVLVDPFCGSGTILHEAVRAGWTASGFDIDEDAVAIATVNAPAAKVALADARKLPLGDRSAHAIVSNLPFGAQYEMQETPEQWLVTVLGEMARILRPGGRAVLLHPLQLPARRAGLTVKASTPLTLLGRRTTLWQLEH